MAGVQFLAAGSQKAPNDHIAQVVLAIVFVVVLVRILGVVCRRIRQPLVIGEVLAGILLGTSLLGQFHTGAKPWTEVLFPLDVRPFLTVLANLGLIIFMFIVGLELDTRLIRGNERKAAVISLSSVALPFAGGALLGLALYSGHQQGGLSPGHSVDKLAFVLFIGASMCVTAFPVLARILTDRGMQRTPLGVIALACAAIDDVIAWTLLAIVSAVAGLSGDPLWEIFAFSAIYVAGMFLLVRPLMGRFITRTYQRAGRLTPDILAMLLVGLLLSAWISDRIGIHFIFGAFVFGVCVPREGTAHLREEILERLEQVSVLVLLPMFFIISGLAVNLTTLSGHYFVELLLVLLVAVVGKFAGALAAARSQGLPPRRSTALALLLNTRGLTELVLLSVGLRLGVLDTALYSMLVLMALVTTFMTAPLLRLAYPDRIVAREIAEAERAATGEAHAFRVLLVLGAPGVARPLVDLAADLASTQTPAQVVLSRFRPQATATAELGCGLSSALEDMAASLDELDTLAAGVIERGVDVAVLSRFSADATADVAEQVESTDADVLLVAPDAGIDQTRLLDRVQVTVAFSDGQLPSGPHGLPVAAVPRPGDSGDAAVALAARLALARRVPLLLLDNGGRRVRQLVERLGTVGIGAEVTPLAQAGSASPVAFAVGTPSPDGSGATICVRASRVQAESPLALLIGSLSNQAPAPAGALSADPYPIDGSLHIYSATHLRSWPPPP